MFFRYFQSEIGIGVVEIDVVGNDETYVRKNKPSSAFAGWQDGTFVTHCSASKVIQMTLLLEVSVLIAQFGAERCISRQKVGCMNSIADEVG